MSVINKMLKDLESRQQQHQVTNLESVAAAKLPQQSGARVWLWVLLVVLLLAFAASGVWMWLKLEQQARVSPMQASQQSREIPETSQVQQPESIQAEAKSGSNDEVQVTSVETTAAMSSSTAVKAQPQALESELKAEPVPEVKQRPAPAIAQVANTVSAQAEQTDSSQPELASVVKAEPVESKPAGKMEITPVPMSPKELAAKRLELGEKAEQDGNLARAESEFKLALEYNPALHAAREQLAAVQYGQSRLDLAAQTLVQGIEAFPQYQNYKLLLAKVFQANGQAQRAFDSLSAMQASGGMAIEKWALMGDLAQDLNQMDKAEQAYNQLLALQPGDGRWLTAKAYVIDSQGRFSDAAGLYRQALSSNSLSDSAVTFVQQRLAQLGAVE